jgi:hypothetical protein
MAEILTLALIILVLWQIYFGRSAYRKPIRSPITGSYPPVVFLLFFLVVLLVSLSSLLSDTYYYLYSEIVNKQGASIVLIGVILSVIVTISIFRSTLKKKGRK